MIENGKYVYLGNITGAWIRGLNSTLQLGTRNSIMYNVGTGGDDSHRFFANNIERLRINLNGQVKLGDNISVVPDYLFAVEKTVDTLGLMKLSNDRSRS